MPFAELHTKLPAFDETAQVVRQTTQLKCNGPLETNPQRQALSPLHCHISHCWHHTISHNLDISGPHCRISEISTPVRCDAVSLNEWLLTFRRKRISSKRREPSSHRHGVTCRKSWILIIKPRNHFAAFRLLETEGLPIFSHPRLLLCRLPHKSRSYETELRHTQTHRQTGRLFVSLSLSAAGLCQ